MSVVNVLFVVDERRIKPRGLIPITTLSTHIFMFNKQKNSRQKLKKKKNGREEEKKPGGKHTHPSD